MNASFGSPQAQGRGGAIDNSGPFGNLGPSLRDQVATTRSGARTMGPAGRPLGSQVGALNQSRPISGHATPFETEARGQAPRQIDLKLAEMAQDVYDLDSRGVDGWIRLDAEQLAASGIRPDLLENAKTGFRAEIYTDGQGRYVLAFAGTNDLKDWIANGGQGLGFDADQYAQGKDLAVLAHQAFGDDLVITGHSLGGGLAATAALATDSAGVTFNAAGLHSNTIHRLGLTPDDARALAEEGLIRNYVVDGEILTYAQEEGLDTALLMPNAVGHEIELADPHGFWKHLNPLNQGTIHRFGLHSMETVLEALGREISTVGTSALDPWAQDSGRSALNATPRVDRPTFREAAPDTSTAEDDLPQWYRVNGDGSGENDDFDTGWKRFDSAGASGQGTPELPGLEDPLVYTAKEVNAIISFETWLDSSRNFWESIHGSSFFGGGGGSPGHVAYDF